MKSHIGIYHGKVQNVVLGCTHYPLVQDEINEVLGGNIKFFNGAKRLAIHLKEVLKEKNLLQNESLDSFNPEKQIEFIDSQNSLKKEERFFEIIKKSITNV